MKHIIVGTAGHIDHGKTALVRALTGIDADRLKEEKLRGITIDLGFAHLLYGDVQIGFIDVPGHERFVHNMLAGMGGIDYALLVVAADESVMPQTKEHFDICRLLAIKRGAVIITKVDLVDPEMLELVTADVEDLVVSSFLENAPVFQVSSKTGEGVEDLKQRLHEMALEVEDRLTVRAVRLPVDRVFTVKGFGTVVTGTLLSGSLHKEQDVEFLPGPRATRIRNLQSYSKPVTEVHAGQRAAVNVQGLDVSQIWRGMVLAEKGTFSASSLLDVRIEVLKHSPVALKNLSRVHLHIGSHEVIAKVALFDRQALEPGSTGHAQLRLEKPTVSAHGDRFILRRFSPLVTIGGGVVLHSHPPKLRRRSEARVTANPQFETADEIAKLRMDIEFAGLVGRSESELSAIFGYRLSTIRDYLEKLEKDRAVVLLSRTPTRAISRGCIKPAKEKLLAAVREFHTHNPLVAGVAKEELRQRIFQDHAAELFNFVVQELALEEKISLHEDLVGLFGRQVTVSGENLLLKEALEALFKNARLNPPRVDEVLASYGARQEVAKNFFHMLLREARLVRISEDVTLHTQALKELKDRLEASFPAGARFSVGEFKDLFGLTRKFAIPILEYLDRQRITRRTGDERILL